jgi:hypothetical protein
MTHIKRRMTMTLFKPVRILTRIGLMASLAMLGLVQAPFASADMVLLANTSMVRGASTADLSFAAPSAGTVTATLLNQSWSGGIDPLGSLSFMANSGNGVLASWSGTAPATTESFQVGAGTYFAHIMAAASGPADVGLYSLNLSFVPSAVPLPMSEWMLVIGVLMLFGLTRLLTAFGSFERFRLPALGG